MKVKHEWIVSGKDANGEFSVVCSTRKNAREQIFVERQQQELTLLKRLDPITHRVYQLVKEEKVS